jgi:hypothetical protein
MPAHSKDFGSEKRKPRHKAEKYPIDDLDKLKFRADLDLMIKNGDKLINGKEARTVLLSKIWDTTQAKINPERLLNGIYSMISQPAKVATGGKLECSQLVADFPIILKEARKAISS